MEIVRGKVRQYLSAIFTANITQPTKFTDSVVEVICALRFYLGLPVKEPYVAVLFNTPGQFASFFLQFLSHAHPLHFPPLLPLPFYRVLPPPKVKTMAVALRERKMSVLLPSSSYSAGLVPSG